MPNLTYIWPSDPEETIGAWKIARITITALS